MNKALRDWFKAGIQEHMQLLATAEENLTSATQLAVDQPSPTTLNAATSAAQDVLVATRDGLSWLATHRCPDDRIGGATERAFNAFRHAGRNLVEMGEGEVPMTPLSGEIASYSIFVARRRLYDAAMTFAEEIAR